MSLPKCGYIGCNKPTSLNKRGKPRRFCSPECDKADRRIRMKGNTFRKGLMPTNAFVAGHATWNKGLKGLHLSPDTEFQPGHTGNEIYPVGTVRIWRDKSGTQRAYIKVGMPSVWLPRAIVTWLAAGRAIPDGLILHHKDGDATNDSPDAIDNLKLVTKAEHLVIHRSEIEPKRRDAIARRMEDRKRK